jgi:hypothetical protein
MIHLELVASERILDRERCLVIFANALVCVLYPLIMINGLIELNSDHESVVR